MHTYTKPLPRLGLPSIGAFTFNDALDVVGYAELDATIGWKTWPEIWHLDSDGRFQCYYKGCTGESLVRWARKPADLRDLRAMASERPEGCTDRWLIVDSRPLWLNEPPTVDEADARAFLTIRRRMGRLGVTVVDAVVFDDEGHWWSMHELTAGTTAWAA